MDIIAVAKFLKQHPDFFSEYPDLITTLKIPHADSGTSSLIERQVEVLRNRNQDLQQKLRRYEANASDNEALLKKLHQFQMSLLDIENLKGLAEQLEKAMCSDFQCDFVRLVFFSAPIEIPAPLLNVHESVSLDMFADFRKQNQTVCGRIKNDKLKLLFHSTYEQVKSSALIPFGHKAPEGLLALGSSDEHKFFPGMGTLFLNLMGQMLGQCVRRLSI